MQAKLLKVIESRCFRRLGGDREIQTDVRFIAATHRDLWARVGERQFREDLLYRLNVVQVAVPPLRDRPWRIPMLAKELLAEVGKREGRKLSLTSAAELLLMQQTWRGNIRELANVLARASSARPAPSMTAGFGSRSATNGPRGPSRTPRGAWQRPNGTRSWKRSRRPPST